MAIASAIFAIPGAGIGIGNLMMKSEKLASAGKAVRAVSKFTQSAIGVGAGMSIATVGYQNLRHSIEAGEFSLTDLATFIGGLTIAAISGKGLISSGKDFASLFDDVGKTSKAGKGYLTDADVNSMLIGGSKVTLQTGGRQIDYDAYIKRLNTIDSEYANIRIDTTDISKIAQNTGMPEWKIRRIKEHVFYNEHLLDSGLRKFDADPEIADAWYRLTDGNYNQNDLDLLNHEYFESKYEKVYQTDYRTAHNKAEEAGRIWNPYKEVD